MTTIVVISIIIIILTMIFSSSNTKVRDDVNGPTPGRIYQITPKDTQVMCREDIYDRDKKIFTKGQVYQTSQESTVLSAYLVVIDNFGQSVFFDWKNSHFAAVR